MRAAARVILEFVDVMFSPGIGESNRMSRRSGRYLECPDFRRNCAEREYGRNIEARSLSFYHFSEIFEC
jgi:hypothetical protein